MPFHIRFAFSWLVPAAALGAIYFHFSTRFPIWNFDDITHYSVAAHSGWSAVVSVFLGRDIPGEYRTYSLARVLQFALVKIFGDRPFVFFAFMAIAHAVAASLIYAIIRRAAPHREALACGLIWLFSPFSISGTFHHYSYIVLPFVLLLLFIWKMENTEGRNFTRWDHVFLASTAVVMCLSGEAVLPSFFAYLGVKLCQRLHVRRIFSYGALVAGVLMLHFVLLKSANPSTAASRFSASLPSLDKLMLDVGYFMRSVTSAILQGFQLTATSFEPYYPGLQIYSFTWQHLSAEFMFSLAIIFLLAIKASTRLDSSKAHFAPSILWIVVIVAASTWTLYALMLLSGARLYSTGFALQLRYGYVVLPASSIALFLAWRRLAKVGALDMRPVAWAIPAVTIFCWLGAQSISGPAEAAESARTTAMLKAASTQGVRLVETRQPPLLAKIGLRPFGIENPFVRWADSPYQQDWTTSNYLQNFSNLEVASPPFIKWSAGSVLLINEYRAAREPIEGKFVFAGAASTGESLKDYPHNDLVMSIPLDIRDALYAYQKDLLDGAVKFASHLELQRVLKFGQDKSMTSFLFGWNDRPGKYNVFVHFLGADGEILFQADHFYDESMLRLAADGPDAKSMRLKRVEVPAATASRVVRLGVGIYTVDPDSEKLVFDDALGGLRDWGGKRLLIVAH